MVCVRVSVTVRSSLTVKPALRAAEIASSVRCRVPAISMAPVRATPSAYWSCRAALALSTDHRRSAQALWRLHCLPTKCRPAPRSDERCPSRRSASELGALAGTDIADRPQGVRRRLLRRGVVARSGRHPLARWRHPFDERAPGRSDAVLHCGDRSRCRLESSTCRQLATAGCHRIGLLHASMREDREPIHVAAISPICRA